MPTKGSATTVTKNSTATPSDGNTNVAPPGHTWICDVSNEATWHESRCTHSGPSDEEQSQDLLDEFTNASVDNVASAGPSDEEQSQDLLDEFTNASVDNVASAAKSTNSNDTKRSPAPTIFTDNPFASFAAGSNTSGNYNPGSSTVAKSVPASKPPLAPLFQKKFGKRELGGDADGIVKKKRKVTGSNSEVAPSSSAGGNSKRGVKVLKSGGDEPCGGQAGDNGGDERGDESKFVIRDGKLVPIGRICTTVNCIKYRSYTVAGNKHCVACGKKQGLEVSSSVETCAEDSCESKVQNRGYCNHHQFKVESDRKKRVKATNALFKSASIQLPARFEVNVDDLSMLEQLPPPGFDSLFERFQQSVAAFEEDKTEANLQETNNAYNACVDFWRGVSFPHPPHKPVPPPQIDDVNTLSGPSRVQTISSFRRDGQPTGVICNSGIPTGEDVVRGAVAVGCRFGDLSMYADFSHCELGHHLKSNQIEIAMSTGVVFRGTVEQKTNELCIKCFGISERDAHIDDPEERANLKLDDYKNGPAGISVHQYIAAAFGLDRESTGGIDHLNRLKTDNRVVNLYSATAKEQNANRSCVIPYSK